MKEISLRLLGVLPCLVDVGVLLCRDDRAPAEHVPGAPLPGSPEALAEVVEALEGESSGRACLVHLPQLGGQLGVLFGELEEGGGAGPARRAEVRFLPLQQLDVLLFHVAEGAEGRLVAAPILLELADLGAALVMGELGPEDLCSLFLQALLLVGDDGVVDRGEADPLQLAYVCPLPVELLAQLGQPLGAVPQSLLYLSELPTEPLGLSQGDEGPLQIGVELFHG